MCYPSYKVDLHHACLALDPADASESKNTVRQWIKEKNLAVHGMTWRREKLQEGSKDKEVNEKMCEGGTNG